MITTARRSRRVSPRHAKPRRSVSPARAGVAGGILGTLALTAMAPTASAQQADPGPRAGRAQAPTLSPGPHARQHHKNTGPQETSGELGTSGRASAPAQRATGSAAAVVDFARSQLGKSFVLGATGPNAYDCSGLVQAAYRQAGIDLPRVSQSQSATGRAVSLTDLQPGDILHWGGRGSATHVAIYVGDGRFVGAQNSRTGVVERTLDWSRPTGAVRVL